VVGRRGDLRKCFFGGAAAALDQGLGQLDVDAVGLHVRLRGVTGKTLGTVCLSV